LHRLFISDLHLSDDSTAVEAALYSLIERESSIDSLIILGDLFEAWVGDDDDAPLAIRIKALLRSVAARGTELFLATGNRDFMLGKAFADEVGANLLDDETVLDVCGESCLLMHGDSLCTDDTTYQQFREMVRAPSWQAEMMSRDLDARRELARQLREMSIDAASNKAEDIMDVNPEAVIAAMQRSGVKRMIHGHTHRPARHVSPSGEERIVLGDWTAQHGWLLREQGGSLSLEQFTIG
jgi:UDP-2,3-diacylglucosamine hydrolase